MSLVRAELYPVLVHVESAERRRRVETARRLGRRVSGTSERFHALLPLTADQLASFHVRCDVSGHPVSVSDKESATARHRKSLSK